MNSFTDYTTHRADMLQEHILAFFESQNNNIPDEISKVALSRIKQFSTGGKMLRGIFTLMSFEMFGGTIDKNILNLATVMELSQTALLIHDDIIDNDLVRRHEKTVYALYMEDAKKMSIENPTEYGKSMAIVIADVAIFLTYELIGSMEIKDTIRSKIMKMYSSEMIKVARGQFMDYYFSKVSSMPNETEITSMYQLKTGSYTFSLPFLLGAKMSGATKNQCKILEEITTSLGIVFQIKDDELGLFGDTKKTGKIPGADLQENKRTLLLSMLLSKVDNTEREIVSNILGKQVDARDIKYLRQLMDKYAVLTDLTTKVNQLSLEAEKKLSLLSLDARFQQIFLELIRYNATREK